MEWALWLWALLVLVQLQVYGCFGCLGKERIALLELKASINQPNFSSVPYWRTEGSDCCHWDYVVCSNTTGRVIKLDLRFVRDWDLREHWYLNSSLFLPFEELNSLDLSGNQLVGWIENEGIEKLSRLGRLEELDLSYNNFNTSILSSLGALSSLKSLNLQGNEMEGPTPVQGLAELSRLRRLEFLDLSSNYFNASILSALGALSSLKSLYLRDTEMEGPAPPQGLCQLKSLQVLDLSNSGFEGILPSCLGNLTSLQVLDISFNEFVKVTSPVISSLTSLKYLSLLNTHFQGSFSFSSLANHSKLEVLESNTVLEVETEYPTWVPAFQLKILRLSHCTFNKPTSELPKFLHYQYDLRLLDLSHNNLKGKFPTRLLENNTRLEVVNLKNNSFSGLFHLPSCPNVHTSALDVSSNHFHGQIPANISLVLPNLQFLNMSKNCFEGITSSFGDMRRLRQLDLSNNNLSGEIPKDLVMGCSSLEALALSNNKLQGQILLAFSNLTKLRLLQLDRTGSIPHSLSNSSRLEMLDISNNYISGRLPGWTGNIFNLILLLMSKNHLEGPIPIEFCTLDNLQYLDLSENNLNGSIPSCFNPPNINYVHLHKNWLQGPLIDAFSKSSSLVTLNIACNYFTGSIPNWIGELSSLKVLILKGNYFEGKIPIQLCQLSQIDIMDLSHNNLFGQIPSCLNNNTFNGYQGSGWEAIGIDLWDSELIPSLYSDTRKPIYSLVNNEGDVEFTTEIRLDFYGQQQVEFTSKSRSDFYKGIVLDLMSGIDLSCNKLTGHIPVEIGTLGGIHALNLSHNSLTGPIPTTFSNLKQIESLDLSYNNLNGTIPSQLTELTFLEVFTVAYNNLSGRMPDIKGQYATFDESSYEGNTFLCGELLKQNCSSTQTTFNKKEKEDGSMDMTTFYICFAASYLTVLLGIVAVLYINPYWRWMWFHLIEVCITFSYYFVLDHLP